jgi:hypothetical protein
MRAPERFELRGEVMPASRMNLARVAAMLRIVIARPRARFIVARERAPIRRVPDVMLTAVMLTAARQYKHE